jgi:hypothetical protein
VPEQSKYAKCGCESCGGHIEYPVELGGSTIDCPHCHFPTPLPKPPEAMPPKPKVGSVFAFIMLLLVAAIGYGAWRMSTQGPAPTMPEASTGAPETRGVGPTNRPSAVPAPAPVQWNGLEAGPVILQKGGEGSLLYAVGEVTNVTEQQKFGVKVLVELFDDKGGKIGAATDYAQSIGAGKSWRFRAMVVDRGAVKAEIKEVTQD